MKKIIFYAHIYIWCVFCALPILFTPATVHAEQDADAELTRKEIDTNQERLSQIIQSVIDNQKKILIDIEAEQKRFQETLLDDIAQISTLRQKIYNDFSKVYQVYWINKEHPSELGLVAEQLHRFTFQLNERYIPLTHTQKQIQLRLQQLNNLIESINTIGNEEAAVPMLQRAKQLQNSYTFYNTRLEKALSLTQHVLDRITSTDKELEAKMPFFWLDYYFHQKTQLFSQFQVWQEEHFFSHALSLIKVTILREIPLSFHSWSLLLTSLLYITMPFFFVGFLAYKCVGTLLPAPMQAAAKHILFTTIPWIFLGIALQYAAWYGGNRYQIINAIGMFLQSYGQIRLAWQMLCLKRTEDTPKNSPFLLVPLVLICAFFLLTLTDITVLFSFAWILFLVFLIIQMRKADRVTFTLSRYLLRSLYGIISIGIFLVIVAGYTHLSFFIILLYLCIITGIHQVEACLHATSLLNSFLPQSGVRALIYGLLFAIFLPILLTLALVAPLSWMLAFPGGEYLVSTLGNFNINVGELSFNALQVLSIATVFYLIKSIISVSCHYIDNTWTKQSNDALASLSTPIKTTIFFGFWAIFALYVLQSVGFNLSNIAVIAGGLSVGIGLGLQGIVQNTFSGFFLIFGQNIREGDMVDVGTVRGIVQKVSLRATRVRTFDNAIVFVPNSEFMARSFINWTHNGHKARCIIPVGVAYASDLTVVKNAVMQIIEADKRIATNPEPHVFFIDFAASALNFEIRFWVYNVLDRAKICSDIRFALNTIFKEHNIQIPYPQTDIHVHPRTLDTISTQLQQKTLSKPMPPRRKRMFAAKNRHKQL